MSIDDLPPSSGEHTESTQGSVVVALRTRPFLPAELEHAGEEVPKRGVTVEGGKDMIVKLQVKKWNGIQTKEERFTDADHAYGPEATNEQIYEDLLKSTSMLTSAISGGVSLILAYGQTGSGKTHTIQALQHQLANDLFDAAATFARDHFPSSEVPSTDVFAISATIFEVQGNKARDLLVPGPVEIAEDKHGMVQTDASIHVVTRPAELVDLIGQATASRATSATKKNDTSSRSHCLLTLTIQNKLYPMAQPGKILVVDLAGSERASDRESHSRERMEESQVINESLSCLKDCVRARAMVESHRRKGEYIHVPYRSSKLTLVLKPTFDLESTAVSQTIIIAHASPHLADAAHSNNTLSYVHPFKIPAPKLTSTEVSQPVSWSNAQFKNWVARTSTKVDPDKFAPNAETGRAMADLTQEEFVARAMAAQKEGAKLTKAGAEKFYLALWARTFDSKTHAQPHIIAGKLALRDPSSWTAYQVQDYIDETFPALSGPAFCPEPMRGKDIMELGESAFIPLVLRAGQPNHPPPTPEDALAVRRHLWSLKIEERTAGRSEQLKRKPRTVHAGDE